MAELTPKDSDNQRPGKRRSTSGKIWPLLMPIVLSLIAVAFIVLIVRVVNDSDKPHHSQYYSIEGFEGGPVVGYVSLDAYNEAMAAHDRNDIMGFVKVTRSGRGLYLSQFTLVKPMGDQRGELTQVRVLNGEHKDRTVYVPSVYLK